jgi:hypothetical protein
LQFVVEARRAGDDQLGESPQIEWPAIGADTSAGKRIAELEQERDNLQAEVEAWRNSKLIRSTRSLRALYAAARRRLIARR